MQYFRLFVCAFLLLAPPALAQNFPPQRDTYLNDLASLLSPEQERDLRATLRELYEKRGIEFTVLTIDRMENYGHSGAIEPFATNLFNTWGIGDADRDDGLLLLVARYDRVLRIEVGSGYGTSKDRAMKAIIDDVIVPWFKRDDYPEGIKRGVNEVIRDITGSWPGEYDASTPARALGTLQRWFADISAWFYLTLLPLLGFPIQAYRRWRRNTPRHCPVDGSQMARLDEASDDLHLEKGQTVEEGLRSVDYDVWKCPTCAHVTVESYRKLFSGYGACKSCGFRTVQGTVAVHQPATTTSTGYKRTDYHCKNCDNRYSVDETLPMRTESSDSSSSGSSGGGSSSGGGASGGW